MQNFEQLSHLHHASIIIAKQESEDRRVALSELISGQKGNATLLRSTRTGALVSLTSAFIGAVSKVGNLFDGLEPNGSGKKINLEVRYTNDDDHFVVDTSLGAVRIETIAFSGELSLREVLVPLTVTAEYRHVENLEPTSQVAAFAPQIVHGMNFSLEMHRLTQTGETHVILRRLRDNV